MLMQMEESELLNCGRYGQGIHCAFVSVLIPGGQVRPQVIVGSFILMEMERV